MKKFNTSLTKKIAVISLTAAAAFSFVGCNVSTSSTYTETITDSEGNTTTTTTTTTNGETTTEVTEGEMIVATVSFDNQTDFDFAELYFSSSDSDDWGENILVEDTLPVDMVATYNNGLTYSLGNTVCDIKVVDTDGNDLEIDEVDLFFAEDPENIYITFEYDEDTQEYSATIQ